MSGSVGALVLARNGGLKKSMNFSPKLHNEL
jgi:hypothetical protein